MIYLFFLLFRGLPGERDTGTLYFPISLQVCSTALRLNQTNQCRVNELGGRTGDIRHKQDLKYKFQIKKIHIYTLCKS